MSLVSGNAHLQTHAFSLSVLSLNSAYGMQLQLQRLSRQRGFLSEFAHSFYLHHFFLFVLSQLHPVAFYLAKQPPLHPQDPSRRQTLPSLLQSCILDHFHYGDTHHCMIPSYLGVSCWNAESEGTDALFGRSPLPSPLSRHKSIS
jgi:hypothetical protein